MTVTAPHPAPADGPSEARFLRNLEKLAAVAPDFHRLIAGMRDVAGQIVQHPGDADDINFLVDGRLFYGEGLGARAHSRREVARYLAAPQRLSWGPADLDLPALNLARAPVDAFVRQHGLRAGGEPAHHRGSVLVLFGLGLGESLRLLLKERVFRHVIVVEPIADFLWHSLWLQDWCGWYDLLAARGGELHMVLADDAEDLAIAAHDHLMETGTLVDGTYLYGHYSSTALTTCLRRFHDRVRLVSALGYFEDELVMMTNSTRNFMRRPVKLITNGRPRQKSVPAIICGAGPSLGKALPHLAELREGAVLLSAGTTLGSLLHHGIVPDFHCEIENTEENYDALRPVAEAYDLSAVTLIGSATVDARMPDLFGDSLLYVREPGISTALYGTEDNAISATAPNCVTLATRMVARFGFSEVYLFGTDFGSRRPDQHHVADSIWMTDPDWRERYERIAEGLTVPLPGNFGGKAYTNRMLEYFLRSTEALIAAAKNIAFYNCADGVRIDGAAPKLPSQVKLPVARDERLAAIAEIHGTTQAYPPGGVVEPARIRHFCQTYRTWSDRLLAALRGLDGPEGDLIDVHDAIHGSLAEFKDGHRASGVRVLARGSLAMMFRHAFHYAVRNGLVADRDFKAAALEGLVAALTHMQARLDEVMAAEFAFLADPVDNAPHAIGG